ncbi:hypothetical protein IE53DRAFT_333680 [Violaceomyces palustris]|uniref:Uncharacterized protein n=1 Tax=Violaceomyces palustris TaxID=1673888 RepID=A0ACD0NRK2_9BASI|nr:hypothetical protein IE53DRAFT_333680 [Violaceomyces palustris]
MGSQKFRLPTLPPRVRIALSLLAISGNTILTTFLNGALTVALPTIGKSIHLSQESLQWPLSMFSLANGALLLFSGAMADAFGRKNVFLTGTTSFFLVSLLTSFCKDGPQFIASCAALGVGAALLIPAGVGILGSSIPEGKFKNQAFALLGAAQPVGFIIGLVLGGLLSAQWRTIFWVQTGLTATFGICALLALPQDGESLLVGKEVKGVPSIDDGLDQIGEDQDRDRHRHHQLASDPSLPNRSTPFPSVANPTSRRTRSARLRTFDWLGALISTSGLVMLTFALADAETAPRGWRTPYIVALLPTSFALLLSFVLWENHLEKKQRTQDLGAPPCTPRSNLEDRTTAPLLPPAIWRAPKFGALLSVVFLAWMSFNVMSYLATLVLQEVQDVSPAKTSIFFFPMVGSGLVLNFVSGALVGRLNAFWLILVGTACGATACVILSAAYEVETQYTRGMLWIMMLQVGPDLFFPAGNLYACNSVGRLHQALAGSLFGTTTRLASSFGLAVSASLASAVTARYSNGVSPPFSAEALLKGYKAASWFCLACSLSAMLIAVLSLRNIGVVGSLEPKVEAPVEEGGGGGGEQGRIGSVVIVSEEEEGGVPGGLRRNRAVVGTASNRSAGVATDILGGMGKKKETLTTAGVGGSGLIETVRLKKLHPLGSRVESKG